MTYERKNHGCERQRSQRTPIIRILRHLADSPADDCGENPKPFIFLRERTLGGQLLFPG